jgi:DNA (cytosine-5)-methyltransferase 1
MTLTVGSLFSGIGGFDLGLERAGMRIAWQSEIDACASAVLKKHWPHVPNYGDVENVILRNAPRVDLVCGGFPCQPFSFASHGVRDGERDARYLWPQMRRLIGLLSPSWVLCENVAAFNGLALAGLASDMDALHYECRYFWIPAYAVGLDHWRERIWILGHSNGNGESNRAINAETPGVSGRDRGTGRVGATHGFPGRMDRLRLLGNAVVPQIAEIIGRAIVESQP